MHMELSDRLIKKCILKNSRAHLVMQVSPSDMSGISAFHVRICGS